MKFCLPSRKWLSATLYPARYLLLGVVAVGSMDVVAQSTLLVAVRDVRDAAPLSGATIACFVGTTQCVLESKQTGQYEARKVPSRSGKFLRLEIQLGNQYAERKLVVKGPSAASGAPIVVYAAKKLPQYTFQFLDKGLEYHTRGEFDRALAHFEVAYFSSEPSARGLTQFDVKLKYNYARSIANTCLRAGYDTCADARRLYSELSDDAGKYPDLFRRERIGTAELDRTIRDIDAIGVGRQYAEFKELFSAGEYSVAAQEGEKLLVQFDRQPSAFADVRLTKDRLKEDVGVAYFRASTDANMADNKTEAKEFLDNSHKHFSEIDKKSSGVAMDIQAIEQRMSGQKF